MTTILLVAEGAHEHGDNDDNSALAILVRRLLDDSSDVHFVHARPNDKVFRRYRPRGKGSRYSKVIAGFLRGAELDGFDAVVFLIDEDGDSERQKAIDGGQATPEPRMPRACGLAIQTFDAWMLADETAIGQALGETVDRQPDPEKLPSPKADFRRLHDGSTCEERPRDVYANIAHCVNLEVLTHRCPRGFAPFRERLAKMRAGLAGAAYL